MFAPPVAKPKAMPRQRSTVVAQRPGPICAQSGAHAPAEHRQSGDAPASGSTRARSRTEPVYAKEKMPGAWRAARQAFCGISARSRSFPSRAEQFQMPPLFPAPRPPIQAKLEVGAVNDPLEHEADRVADQVMRMPAPEVFAASAPPQISRKCAACEEEEKLQKKEAGALPVPPARRPPACMRCCAPRPAVVRPERSLFRTALWTGFLAHAHPR